MSWKAIVDSPVDTSEKAAVEEIRVAPSSISFETAGVGGHGISTARLLRKLDWNLIPFISLLYLLSFLDRSNVGNARLAGLERDLGLKGLDYNIALAVFFPFYIIAEIPSNIMMKRTSPSLWLCIIMFTWGTCMTLMGIVQNFTGLLFARMGLGLAEGGLFPGVAYYITLWYRRHETGFRIAIFFSAATLAGAFGGLLARGISQMDGIGGRPGWSWIFIIEGLVTVVVAIIARSTITDDPDSARFLSEEEKTEVKGRLKRDTNDLANEYAFKYVLDALKDWKIWTNSLSLVGVAIPVYSIAFFLPTILKNMGYSNAKSQLMSVPPYVFGCITTIAVGYAADVSHTRGPFAVAFNILAIVGMIMLIATHKSTVQYIGTYLVVCGVYSNTANIISWNANNIGGSTKRAVGIAIQIGLANVAGMVSAFSFRSTDAPRYFSGHGLLIGSITMSAILSVIMHVYLVRENARRDTEMEAQGLALERYTDEMKSREREKGDDATVLLTILQYVFLAHESIARVGYSTCANTAQSTLQQQTGNWGSNPTNVGFFYYKPLNLPAKPALIVAMHYCSGTAQAFFSGTQFANLADTYKYIVINPDAPDSGGCWEAHTTATLTHNGGGDSIATANMVRYAIAN
ncbi:hypothetical protein AN958_02329 [Leucoagaricus sp. SymC.cos]|nr:hypothetical protein AN958_02329 [Leucoagaricus sp. SymC.cos]